MNLKSIAAVSVVAVSLSACANSSMGQKQSFGGVLGAVGGAVAGAQFGKGKGQLVGVAAGTLLGALIGSEVGRSLDQADQLVMAKTTQSALERSPSNQKNRWSNPDSGNAGVITPKPAYTDRSGKYCREFQQTISVGGREQSAYGTACRQPDGSWKIVSTDSATAQVSAVDPAVKPITPRRAPVRRAPPRHW